MNTINLPTNAEVHCSDGVIGCSTYAIVNPIKAQMTHLVVKSSLPPFQEVLVSLDQVEETAPNLIRLKCNRSDFLKMETFEYDENIRTEAPDYLSWPYLTPMGRYHDEIHENIPVKNRNISQNEVTVRQKARVEATDGYIGLVAELLIDSTDLQVTHLVVLNKHLMNERQFTIPIAQIDHVEEDTVYLKMDRQSVEMLPETPN